MIIPYKERNYKERNPKIGNDVFIAPDAWVIGDVEIGDNCSIFFGAVLRGDIQAIRIGARTNIQEHCMVHTSRGRKAAVIGDEVTVGHRALIHGATIESGALIGMGSIILDDAVIGEESLVGAGALVTEGKTFPKRSLIIGSPAKLVRSLSDADVAAIRAGMQSYVEKGKDYRKFFC